MDESCSKNNSLMRKSRCLNNKQVQKSSNSSSLSDVKSISKDENNSITESKSSLPTKKQRLKEYLISKTPSSENNAPITHDSHDSSENNEPITHDSHDSSVNFVSKIDNYNKPVKVKSRWTRTSQMEMELVIENSASLLTENTPPENIAQCSKKINETSTMAVTPSCSIKSLKDFDRLHSIQLNDCCVVLRKCVGLQKEPPKRKRGRPKKNVTKVEDKVTKKPNLNKKDLVKPNSSNDLKPVLDSLKTVKRSRGRPKKNATVPHNNQTLPVLQNLTTLDSVQATPIVSSTTAMPANNLIPSTTNELPPVLLNSTAAKENVISLDTFQTQPILLNTPKLATTKRRGRKKGTFTNTKKKTTKIVSAPLKKCVGSNISNNLEKSMLEITESSNFSSSKLSEVNCANNILMNEDCLALEKSEPNESNLEISKTFEPKSTLQVKCDNFENYVDLSEQEKMNCTTNRIVIGSSNDNKQHEDLLKFNEVSWNIVPSRTRSKSVDEFTKIRHRRNSLSNDFVYRCVDGLQNEDNKTTIIRSCKSLSYLEGGPNFEIERYERKELDKKYRSELKRSRSFPNCMFLDTVIWRYLVYEHTYDSDQNYVVLSDSEMNLINELPLSGYDREYRSKSVPVERCEYKPDKESFGSLDDLNKLRYTNNLPVITFQVPSGESDLKVNENNLEESEGKRRRSKRLNTKVKRTDVFDEEDLLDFNSSKIDYLLLAEQIRQESERQLAEARKNDPELEKKLKLLNFILITNNMYRPDRSKMSEYTPAEAQVLRRLKRKAVNVDPNVLCECTYTKKDWIERNPGCGEGCLNRLLNIECGSGCSLKSFCTNKQFQNKQFKRTQIVKTPNKGYGVFALEDILCGSFVDEYVGEVIDQHEMIKRMKKKLYKNNNYMVQLKHDEIIDATRKGNITRFINHSCEPNCIAEKWHVLGESRMGFFSSRKISKGEEITFDYSFQIFGDAAQQKCYCGTPKCRGFISKKSRAGEQSSSDESEDNEENEVTVSKSDQREEKKKKITVKRITNKDKKRLRELDRQLTDISNLKNKNRSDLENSTLNLNKLMVHITDSMSRSHILKFIREHDMNCKRLFMNFNGLSIIHSWMTSNNNEKLKIEIIKTLSELPISNRNTITKSKVLDIVAEWANIPSNIKEIIENLEYPLSQSEEHGKEVDKLLPDKNNVSLLIQVARALWKKWIILKMVFKIPKLERSKEVNIPKTVLNKSSILQLKPKVDQYHFEKPTIPCQLNEIHREHSKYQFNAVKKLQSQDTTATIKINSIDTFSKIINHQNQIDNRDKSKAVLEWNKKHWEYSALKTNNKVNTSSSTSTTTNTLKDPKRTDSNAKRNSSYAFNFKNKHYEIPTIGSATTPKIMKWIDIPETTPSVDKLTSVVPFNSDSTKKMCKSRPTKYYSIEEIITTNKTWCLPPPTIVDLYDEPTLQSILQTAPPPLPNNVRPCKSPWPTMRPENLLYDARYPSIKEQIGLSLQATVNVNNELDPIEDKKDIDKEKNKTALQPVKNNLQIISSKILKKQSDDNVKILIDKGLLNILKSGGKNYFDTSPIKISPSFFRNKSLTTNLQLQNCTDILASSNLIKNLKIVSNFYREQPSNIIKVNNIKLRLKSRSQSSANKNKNDLFKVKEDKKTEKTNNKSSVNSKVLNQLSLYNEQLSTSPQNLNIRKLIGKQTMKVNTKNNFALKILNGIMKTSLKAIPDSFVLNLPKDTKIITHDPREELELYHKLVPTVKNTLCAKIKKGDDKNDNINVFKQKVVMKYDESLPPKPKVELGSSSKVKPDLLNNIEGTSNALKTLKRKMPLPPTHSFKCPKIAINRPIKSILKSKNQATTPNQNYDDTVFKKPMVPLLNKKKNYLHVNKSMLDGLGQRPTTSRQIVPSTPLLKTNSNYISQKPLMKCLPFNKVDNTAVTDAEQHVKNLAKELSLTFSNNLPSSTQTSSDLIDPIVETYKSNTRCNKNKIRGNLDDPIVREYMNRSNLETLKLNRKCKLPESMTALPSEVLQLIPDSPRELKIVIDFFHTMASVIVKVLDLYVKKSCKQGRIRNDEDFKYLAKKLNANILYKELQMKKVEDLRISDSVKLKVEQYIKKYMLKYGKVFKRKNPDQGPNADQHKQ